MKLLLEIHSSSYGNHTASRNLVGKAFQAAFYWPTANFDVEDLVRRSEGYQFFRQANTRADTRTTEHPSFLALRMLGTVYDRVLQASARWFLVHVRRH